MSHNKDTYRGMVKNRTYNKRVSWSEFLCLPCLTLWRSGNHTSGNCGDRRETGSPKAWVFQIFIINSWWPWVSAHKLLFLGQIRMWTRFALQDSTAFQAFLANELHILSWFKFIFCHQKQYHIIPLQLL